MASTFACFSNAPRDRSTIRFPKCESHRTNNRIDQQVTGFYFRERARGIRYPLKGHATSSASRVTDRITDGTRSSICALHAAPCVRLRTRTSSFDGGAGPACTQIISSPVLRFRTKEITRTRNGVSNNSALRIRINYFAPCLRSTITDSLQILSNFHLRCHLSKNVSKKEISASQAVVFMRIRQIASEMHHFS